MPRSAITSPRTGASRSALPQNYINKPGTLFESFDDVTNWTPTNGTVETDTENYIEGISGVKLTLTAGQVACHMVKAISPALNMQDLDRDIAIDIYLHSPVDKYNYLYIYLSVNTAFGSYMSQLTSVSAINGLKQGWNRIQLVASDWAATGTSFATAMGGLKLRFSSTSGEGVAVTFGSIKLGYKGKPSCIITFDGMYRSGYDEGVAYMVSKGIKGTQYITPSWVDTDGRMTTAECDYLNDLGWCLGVYTLGWISAGGLEYSAAKTTLEQYRAWMVNNGWTRGINHAAYSTGLYTSNEYPYATNALLAMSDVGMKTGRAGDCKQVMPPYHPYMLGRLTMTSTTTLTAAQAHVDDAVKYGLPAIFLIHTLTASPAGNDWSIANFQALINYILAKNIPCLTMDEFYEGLTNPRYEPASLTRTAV